MPRYEYSQGTSNKFWEIEVSGNEYTVQYGRIGTVGQTSTKSFADAATAQKKADAATRSKVNKGYVLVSTASADEKSARVEERLVEADRLQESGDPRGRLIPVQNEMARTSGADRANLRKVEASLLSEHAEALLGPLNTEAGKACSTVEWKLGYWDRLSIASSYEHQDVETSQLLTEALKHPSAARLDHLHLGIPQTVWDGGTDWQPDIDALAAIGAPELTSLEIADHEDNAEISWCEIGSLAEIWPKVPKLRRLVVRGVNIGLGKIDAPHLRHLELISGGLPAEPVRQISQAHLPELEHLEILFGTEDYGASATIGDCAGILAGSGLPKLTWLGLKNGEFMGEITAAIVKAPILRQLKVLDLSMGTMVDEDAEVLVQHADALAHLEKLDLSDSYLSPGMITRLRKALPNCHPYGQREAESYGDDEVYRYTSIAE